MDREITKEKISYYGKYITLFWTGIFLIGSGMAWVFVNLSGIWVTILLSAGTISEFAFILTMTLLHKRIRKLIKEM